MTIHDVMPDTLPEVLRITSFMAAAGLPPATLLVSTGSDWKRPALSDLRTLQGLGHELAAHGWQHTFATFGGIYHRLHSLALSRNAAEHLALDRRQIIDLMHSSYAWFDSHDLTRPRLYVPPAWAMGNVTHPDLHKLPFRFYETLSGIYDSEARVFHRLPLAGYEADNIVRAMFLKFFNSINRGTACRSGRALRVAIHPHDLHFRLAQHLERLLRSGLECYSVSDIASACFDL